MIEDKLIDPNDLKNPPLKELEDIFYSKECMVMLKNRSVDLKDLMNLYRITSPIKEEYFPKVIQKFQTAVKIGKYQVSDILQKCKDDPLHLNFMSGDPTNKTYERSDKQEIVKFDIENYDIDIEWIRNELRGDRDSDCTAAIDFDQAIDTYEEEYDSDSLIGKDSQLEDVY